MGRKPIRSNSVLKKQKFKNKPRKKNLKRISAFIAGILIIFGFCYFGQPLHSIKNISSSQFFLSLFKNENFAWRIYLKNDGNTGISPENSKDIQAFLQKKLLKETSPNFQTLGESLQKIGSFSSVRLIRIDSNTLIVNVVPRIPKLCVEADQIRFVGDDGNIYGSPTKDEPCPGPVAQGVFPRNRNFYFNRDGTLVLAQDEKQTLEAALLLKKSLDSYQLVPSTISFEKFIGFMITLSGLPTEISLGLPPFDNRIEKLKQILRNLTSQGNVASRVELDYQGKAFIKLQKI